MKKAKRTKAKPTENPWRKGEAKEMRKAAMKLGLSARKWWLHAVACCRFVSKNITHPDCIALIDLIERRADDDSLAKEVTNLRRKVMRWAISFDGQIGGKTWYSRYAAWASAEPHPKAPVWGFSYWYPFRDILAEVVGPRNGLPSFSPTWRTSTSIALSQQMYESRDFGAMPILADALQDAGCDDPAILEHCRDEKQVHVRGCWVVDLVLGKA